MFGGGVRVGKLAGIPISIHPLWVVIVALITWSLGAVYYPNEVDGISEGTAYAFGLLSALLLFASILLHELGHALVARRYGVEIEGIELWLLGGVAKMKGTAHRPQEELRFALAGPWVTVMIVVAFELVALALPSSTPGALRALVEYQVMVNGLILAFNLVPAFPLDGGRALRALLWARWGDIDRATAAAAGVGRGFAYFLISLGVLSLFVGAPGGLWLALIGFFLIYAGRAEQEAMRMKTTFANLGLRRTMATPAVTIPAELGVEEAVREFFVPFGYRSFPVLEGGRVVGLLGIEQVEALTPRARATTRVGELADRDPTLVVGEDVSIEELMASGGFRRHGRAVVLCRDGEVGILSATAIERTIRANRLLAPTPESEEPRPEPAALRS